MNRDEAPVIESAPLIHVQDMPDQTTFQLYQKLIQDKLGIHLPDTKRTMLGHRLQKRLRAVGTETFGQYFDLIVARGHEQELQTALELVTTNETFFFREGKHFDFLKQFMLKRSASALPLRIWSAACSSGEEPYSIAMLLKDTCVTDWEIVASDVNSKVVRKAQRGVYLTDRTDQIPKDYLRRFCRKGTQEFEGMLRIIPALRSSIKFHEFNLMSDMSQFGMFDVIFLRNVMIYFDEETKAGIITRIAKRLRPGGYLFIGHSESVHGLNLGIKLKQIQPAILQRPEQP